MQLCRRSRLFVPRISFGTLLRLTSGYAIYQAVLWFEICTSSTYVAVKIVVLFESLLSFLTEVEVEENQSCCVKYPEAVGISSARKHKQSTCGEHKSLGATTDVWRAKIFLFLMFLTPIVL